MRTDPISEKLDIVAYIHLMKKQITYTLFLFIRARSQCAYCALVEIRRDCLRKYRVVSFFNTFRASFSLKLSFKQNLVPTYVRKSLQPLMVVFFCRTTSCHQRRDGFPIHRRRHQWPLAASHPDSRLLYPCPGLYRPERPTPRAAGVLGGRRGLPVCTVYVSKGGRRLHCG